MKKLSSIIFMMCCFSAFVDQCMGFPIQVVHSELHVWGTYSGIDGYQDYDITSSLPPISAFVEGSSIGPDWEQWGHAASSASFFEVNASSNGQGCPSPSGNAGAELTVNFNPIQSGTYSITISFGSSLKGTESGNGSLIDFTSNSIIWQDTFIVLSSYDMISNYFDRNHEYCLFFEVFTGSAENDLVGVWLGTDDLYVVTEPATMLLLGSGLFGLAGFRKIFFKKLKSLRKTP